MSLLKAFLTAFCAFGLFIAYTAFFTAFGWPTSFGRLVLGLSVASISFTIFLLTTLYMIGTYL